MSTNDKDPKKFFIWIKLKKRIHFVGRVRTFKEGEVWWCSIGENIGTEINGKSSCFTRPVLILKKLSRLSFVGIPLTSQSHDGSWYVSFVFKNKKQIAVVSQLRAMSVFRLVSKMGTLPNTDLSKVREGFHSLFCD